MKPKASLVLRVLLLWARLVCALCCVGVGSAWAHPMPHTVVKLQILQDKVTGVANIPLPELQSAWQAITPKVPITQETLNPYFAQHISAQDPAGQIHWRTHIADVQHQQQTDALLGAYHEVGVKFELLPVTTASIDDKTPSTHAPNAENVTRAFRFGYDAVLHQVVNHKAVVLIDQDWRTGIYPERAVQVGVIGTDVVSGQIQPLLIQLDAGSWQQGFAGMLRYGAEHMLLGADHMLFLLMLILVAPLAVQHVGSQGAPRWTLYQGMGHTAHRFLWTTTAFTLGHSLTLAAALYGVVPVPALAVEVVIALSIAVSAAHAIRPLFANKEAWVAGFFGWVHGLAFANGLSVMQVDAAPKLTSLLAFNLGLELAQWGLLLLSLPLIALSQLTVYHHVRKCLAGFGLFAAVVLFYGYF